MADTAFEPEIRKSLDWLRDWGPRDVSLAIECKKVQSAFLPFNTVKQHQIEALLEFEKRPLPKKISVPAGFGNARFHVKTEFDFTFIPPGRAYLLVNFRFTKKAPRKDLKKGTNRCFAVTPNQYLSVKKQFESEGRSSIPYKWFVENGVELERARVEDSNGYSYGWDLLPLCGRDPM